MLRANAEHAGIADLFDDLLSTEVNQTYKPDPRAYALGMERLHLKKDEIVFAAFGAWDAYGAKSFGYPTFWVNRFNVPAEELGLKADATASDFQGLLDFVLGKSGRIALGSTYCRLDVDTTAVSMHNHTVTFVREYAENRSSCPRRFAPSSFAAGSPKALARQLPFRYREFQIPRFPRGCEPGR